eukprot:6300226-Prymnesium_polylepis.2
MRKLERLCAHGEREEADRRDDREHRPHVVAALANDRNRDCVPRSAFGVKVAPRRRFIDEPLRQGNPILALGLRPRRCLVLLELAARILSRWHAERHLQKLRVKREGGQLHRLVKFAASESRAAGRSPSPRLPPRVHFRQADSTREVRRLGMCGVREARESKTRRARTEREPTLGVAWKGRSIGSAVALAERRHIRIGSHRAVMPTAIDLQVDLKHLLDWVHCGDAV